MVDAESYTVVSREPAGCHHRSPRPASTWPAPKKIRSAHSRLTYMAGWTVTPESAPGANDAR